MNGHPDSPATPPEADADPMDEATAGLAAAVLELTREVPADPLPGPRWFALLATAELLETQPAFRAVLDEAILERAAWDRMHLTLLELEEVPAESDPLRALEGLELPGIADGLAVVCDLGVDRWAEERADQHPGDGIGTAPGALRVVAAARSGGATWCAVRRAGAAEHSFGARLVPDLATGLAQFVGAPAT